MNKKKILISGATGFLGSWLTHAMLGSGYDVTILKRSTSKVDRISDILNVVNVVDTDKDSISVAFKDALPYEAVIHTAAIYGRHGETASQILETNLKFSLQLLEYASKYKSKRFLNTDTSGDRFLNEYSLSKQQFSEWGRLYANQGKIAFYDIKLEHMYGPSDDPSKFVDYVIKQCSNNVKELNLTAGDQKRDFIYISDVVSAYQLLVQAHAYGYKNVGLGSGINVSIKSLVETIHRLAKSKTKLNFGVIPYRQNETIESHADLSFLKQLGWNNQIQLEEGLRRILEEVQ